MSECSVAVLMATFNRRSSTVACIQALLDQLMQNAVSNISIFHVDSGSTDGTRETVASMVSNKLHQYIVSSEVYWNRAMAIAFEHAVGETFDYYLWLNDDTILHNTTLVKLVATHVQATKETDRQYIVVGSVVDSTTERPTYGGLKSVSRWLPLRFALVDPVEVPTVVDTMNGNCVLIPHTVVEQLGIIDPYFLHNWGDIEYGLRARRNGVEVLLAPGVAGTCSHNKITGTWLDVRLPFRTRIRAVLGPKGLRPLEYLRMMRKYGGPIWPVIYIARYVDIVLSAMIGKEVLKRTEREGAGL